MAVFPCLGLSKMNQLFLLMSSRIFYNLLLTATSVAYHVRLKDLIIYRPSNNIPINNQRLYHQALNILLEELIIPHPHSYYTLLPNYVVHYYT